MKLSKLVKLSAVGVALLLIPRRSSRQSQRSPDERSPNNSHASNSHLSNEEHPINDHKNNSYTNADSDADADTKGNKNNAVDNQTE